MARRFMRQMAYDESQVSNSSFRAMAESRMDPRKFSFATARVAKHPISRDSVEDRLVIGQNDMQVGADGYMEQSGVI